MPRLLTAGCVGLLAVGAIMLLLEPAALFGRAPPPSGEVLAGPRATAVVDGETLRVADTVVRLLGVSAPLRGQTCHRADGSLFDCGAAAAEALAQLIGDRPVACQLQGHDSAARLVAVCRANGRELNQALVIGGWAHGSDEAEARKQHRGLWDGLFDPKT